MSAQAALFSFQGRIARLPYLGYGALIGFVYGLIVGVFGAALDHPGGLNSDATKAIAGIVILVLSVIYFWTTLALLVKRLHDLDLAGTHAIWIVLVNVALSVLSVAMPPLGIVSILYTLGIALWMLFTPGLSRRRAKPSFEGTAARGALCFCYDPSTARMRRGRIAAPGSRVMSRSASSVTSKPRRR